MPTSKADGIKPALSGLNTSSLPSNFTREVLHGKKKVNAKSHLGASLIQNPIIAHRYGHAGSQCFLLQIHNQCHSQNSNNGSVEARQGLGVYGSNLTPYRVPGELIKMQTLNLPIRNPLW